MIRWLLAALLLAGGQARADWFNTNAPAGSQTQVTATGSTTGRTLADRDAQTINLLDYGASGDLVSYSDGVFTAGNVGFSSNSTTYSPLDLGKPIDVSGAGSNGHTLTTTIAAYNGPHSVNLTVAPSASSGSYYGTSAVVVTAQSGGGSYVPGEIVTAAGGTFSAPAQIKALTTKIVGTPAIVSAGSGGTTTTTCTLTGTTGSPRPFRAQGTIAGGVLTAITAVFDAGSYSTDLTSKTAEPITTNCGLTGATVSVVTGVSTSQVVVPGIYSVLPTNPVSQSSTSGAGTGATWTLQTTQTGAYSYGTDNSAAISAAVAQANTLYSTNGTRPCIYIPSRDARFPLGMGFFVSSAIPTHFAVGVPGCVGGDAVEHSVIKLSRAFSGDLFAVYDVNTFNWPLSGSVASTKYSVGVSFRNLTVYGDNDAPVQQNALMLYDHIDNALIDRISCNYVSGYCLAGGVGSGSDATGYWRESSVYDVAAQSSGTVNVPAFLINTYGSSLGADPSNELDFVRIKALRCIGVCLKIYNQVASPAGGNRLIRFFGLRVERSLDGDDLMVIGDPTSGGVVSGIEMYGFDGEQGQPDHALVRITAPSVTYQPYGITIYGLSQAAAGYGVSVDAGRGIALNFTQIGATQASYQIGPSSLVGAIVITSPTGGAATSTYNIDPSSLPNVKSPVLTSGNPSGLGTGALNIQTGQSAPTNTATGVGCIVVGDGTSNCTGTSAIAIGRGNSAKFTGDVTIGSGNVSGAVNTWMFGNNLNDGGQIGHWVWGLSPITVNSDNQLGTFLMIGKSTTATPVQLTTNGSAATSSNVAGMRNGVIFAGAMNCVAKDETTGNLAVWADPKFVYYQPGPAAANVTQKLSNMASVFADPGASAWSFAETADNTFGGIKIMFTGAAGTNIRAVCALTPIVELQ